MIKKLMRLPVIFTLIFICNTTIAMNAINDNHYNFNIQKLSDHDDTFKIDIFQQTFNTGNSQTCSFIANFHTQSITDEQDLFAPFQVNQQFNTFTNLNYPDYFLWSIPEFGLLKLHRNGSVFFGHGADEAPLAHDKLTFNSSGPLFFETLKVASLRIQSKEARLCEAVIADRLFTNNTIINAGGCKIKMLLGNGTYINEGLTEFDSTVEGTAYLTLKKFINKTNKQSPLDAKVTGTNLFISFNNQLFQNKKNSTCDFKELTMHKARNSDSQFFINKGLFKSHSIDSERSITNESLLRAHTLHMKSQQLTNKEFGEMKISHEFSAASPVLNEGSMKIEGNAILTDTTLTNKGDFIGKGNGSFTSSVIDNSGNLTYKQGCLYAINTHATSSLKNNGTWLMENMKSGSFNVENNDNLILKDCSLNFNSLTNKKDTQIKNGSHNIFTITNDPGSTLTLTDATLSNHSIENNGDFIYQQGSISCKKSLRNNGNWLMENITNPLICDFENNGDAEFKDCTLHLGYLTNKKNLILNKGSYTINILLANHTLKLLDSVGQWVITDTSPSFWDCSNHNTIRFSNVPNSSSLGNIECQRALHYHLKPMPQSLTAQGNIYFSYLKENSKDINTLVSELASVKSNGIVSVYCKPFVLKDNLEFPNIKHLELLVQGPATIYGSLKAPKLSLSVGGSLTAGKDNDNLGTIAATHGPLSVKAFNIDGSYGKFYGKEETVLESGAGDIIIGAPARGINIDISNQCQLQWLQNSGLTNSNTFLGTNLYAGLKTRLAGYDYTLDIPNGAYASSGGRTILRSASNILLNLGTVNGVSGVTLYTPKDIENLGGKVSSQGTINIDSNTYTHGRKPTVEKPIYGGAEQARYDYPGSGPAQLESLGRIDFRVKNKIRNIASSIRSGQGLFINGKELEKGLLYIEEPQTFLTKWWNPTGWGCYWGHNAHRILDQSCITQAAEKIEMNLGDFTITGNIHANTIQLHGNTGLFANTKLTRQTLNPTEPILANVTQHMYDPAQLCGMYRIGANNMIETEFPLGNPSQPQEGDILFLANQLHIPINRCNLLNPLSGINLDLHLQQLISNLAGKVYLGNAKGNNISRVLWANANKWRQKHGKDEINEEELKQIDTSMLLAKYMLNHDMTPQQHTLLCIAPNDINIYCDQGDLVAESTIISVTKGDQTHLNNRIIVTGAEEPSSSPVETAHKQNIPVTLQSGASCGFNAMLNSILSQLGMDESQAHEIIRTKFAQRDGAWRAFIIQMRKEKLVKEYIKNILHQHMPCNTQAPIRRLNDNERRALDRIANAYAHAFVLDESLNILQENPNNLENRLQELVRRDRPNIEDQETQNISQCIRMINFTELSFAITHAHELIDHARVNAHGTNLETDLYGDNLNTYEMEALKNLTLHEYGIDNNVITIIDNTNVLNTEGYQDILNPAKEQIRASNCKHTFCIRLSDTSKQQTVEQLYSDTASTHWISVTVDRTNGRNKYLIKDSMGGDNTNHQNVLQLIAALEPEHTAGITITSETGNVSLETQKYTVISETEDCTIIQEKAYPQQQIVHKAGPVDIKAHQNLNRTGTLLAAAKNVTEHAETGSVNKRSLVLQMFIEKRTKDEGFFSSSETVSTSLTHNAQPSSTISGAILHDKAGIAITAIAPQDSAQEKIIYEAPDISIEGLLVADRHTTQSSSSSAFSEQSSFSSKETPYAIPSTIKAPIIQLEGERARINANMAAHELHDNTTQGAQFIAKVAQMLCSGKTLVDSPTMSVDAGYEAGYETMIQPMLMVEKIIRAQDTGRMLFESAIMDKDKTEIIGKFVETTYHLKQWQTSWHNVSQVVPNEALVVVAFAIAIATQGAGFQFLGGMLNNIAGVAGMQLSAAGIAAVNAGFSAVCASTTTSLLQTGDPLQTIKQQFSPEQLKSVAFKMASAGLCAQLGETLNVNMKTEFKSFTEHVCEHAIHNTVDTLLNLAINHVPVEKSLGEMSKDVPLKAVAAYVANKIGAGCTDAIMRKTAHTVLGGLSGFAIQHNRDGLFAGAVGALTAETIGDMLITDAQEISIAASTKLKHSGKLCTPENLERAIDAEVHAKTKWAKIAGGTAAVLTKQNASIALSTASNVIDHDVAIRGKLYALEAFQSMVAATSQAMATLAIYGSANADKEKTNEVKKTPTRRKIKPITKNKQLDKDAYDLSAVVLTKEDLVLHNIHAQSHVDAYDNVILKHAQEQLESEFNDMAHDLTLHHIETQSHPDKYDDVILEHTREKHTSEIKQRKLWNEIKDDSFMRLVFAIDDIVKNPSLVGGIKMLREVFAERIKETVDFVSLMPNPVGIATFATSTGCDIYQEKTTPGEVMFNLALGYGILKGVQYTGRGIKFIYQHGKELAKDVTNKVLMPYPKWRVLRNIEASKAAREASNFTPYPLYPNKSTRRTWLNVESIETLSLDEIRTIQDEVLTYIINKDRQLIITSPLRNRYDHSHLGKGEPVYAAGDIYINNGKITRVNNRSGSYQPSGPQLGNLIENDLYKNGFTEVRGKYIDWLETTDKALLKQYVLRNIAESKAAREASKLRIPFVENPYAGVWKEATISKSLALHDSILYDALCLQWKKNPKAPYSVFGHGDPYSIDVAIKNIPRHGLSQKNLQELLGHGKVSLNEIQLLRLMRVFGYQKGQPIHLNSCNTGAQSDGLAQKLANRAQKLAKNTGDVYVSAPTGYQLLEGYQLHRNKAIINPSFKVLESGKPGIIKTFYPQKVTKTHMHDKTEKETIKNVFMSASNQNVVKSSCLIKSKQKTLYPENKPSNLLSLTPMRKTALATTALILAGDQQQKQSDNASKNVSILSIFNKTRSNKNNAEQKPFVENPKAGIWHTACISNDLVLSSGSHKISYYIQRSNWHQHPQCPFTINAHSNSESVVVNNKDINPNGLSKKNMDILQNTGEVDLNANELAELIRSDPHYKGQHVQLFSCQCGAHDEAVAQLLADELDVPVSAFVGDLIADKNKFTSITLGDNLPIVQEMNPVEFFTRVESGEFKLEENKTFYPRDKNTIAKAQNTSKEHLNNLHDTFIDNLAMDMNMNY